MPENTNSAEDAPKLDVVDHEQETELKLSSLDAVNTDLEVDLVLLPDEAAERIDAVKLAKAASVPEFAQQLLAGVEKARQEKRSAKQIVSALTGILGKVIDIAT